MPKEFHFAKGISSDISGERTLSERKSLLRQEEVKGDKLKESERLATIKTINGVMRRASDLKYLAKESKNQIDRKKFTLELQTVKKQIDELRVGPQAASIELAWREYLKQHADFLKFKRLMEALKDLKKQERAMRIGIGKDIRAQKPAEAKYDKKKGTIGVERKVIIAREVLGGTKPIDENQEIDVELAVEIFGEDWGKELGQSETAPEETDIKTKAKSAEDIVVDIKEIEGRISELWKNPMVRYFLKEEEESIIRVQLIEGRNVVDLPSSAKFIKTMERHEDEEPSSLFGSVLLGPPGTGKTTLVREYCNRTNRNLVEIDLSGDVTRYLFWGTTELIHEDPLEKIEILKKRLESLHEKELIDFLKSGVKQFGFSFLGVVEDAADKVSEVDANTSAEFKKRLNQALDKGFRDTLASEIYKFTKKNGWRAGMLLQALEDGSSVLFNEFNKASDLSFLHGVLEAKAASDAVAGIKEPEQEKPGWYYVADAKKWVRLKTRINENGVEVPKTKFFFTANVGAKYRVQSVSGPLKSRSVGRTFEVGYPPKEEEMLVLRTLVEDVQGRPILDDGSNLKLVWLYGDIIPKIRAYIADKSKALEISFREMRRLANKLVDRETGAPRRGMNVDRAIKEVYIDTYAFDSDKSIPHQILTDLLTHKVITDKAVINEVVQAGYISANEVELILNPPPATI